MQRTERVHYQVEHLFEIERAADRFCDVEQHAQLVDGRAASSRESISVGAWS